MMFQRLRQYFALLYTLSTGLILTLVILIIFLNAKDQQFAIARQLLTNTMETLEYKVETEAMINSSELTDLANKNHVILLVEDNGLPFYPPDTRQNLTNQALFQAAKQEAYQQGIDTSRYPIAFDQQTQSSIFHLKGRKRTLYYAQVSVIVNTDSWQTLAIIQDITSLYTKLFWKAMAYLLLDIAGIVLLYLIIWRITGRMLAPLEESQQKQKEFIAAASHELKSPLALIRVTISSLLSNPLLADQKNLREDCSKIDTESVRMAGLIDDLLLLASMRTASWTLTCEPIDMDTILIDLWESYQHLAMDKGLTLLLNLPEDSLPTLQADSKRLRQILMILLDNAMTYTPAPGTITIGACYQKHHLRIRVEDTGIGIDKDSQNLIFDRFYQADTSRNSKNHFGLGLSIAKELTELQGGQIQCKSTGGQGTIFIVSFPAGNT